MNLGSYVHVYLKTTETCNLDCSHCFTSGSNGAKIYFNPEKTLDFFDRLTKEQRHINKLHVVLHGGEPMLFPVKKLHKFCDELRDMMKERGVEVTYGIQTNLVYKLTDSIRHFFKCHITHFGTSWDYNMRFEEWKNTKKLDLWKKNVDTLALEDEHRMTLMVCMTHDLIRNKQPFEIIDMAIQRRFSYILFERVTGDGNASLNPSIFPNNHDLDDWMHKMFRQTLERQYHRHIGNMLLSELAIAYTAKAHTANRCRQCELKLLTINADGSLAGCPNTAPVSAWGHIDWPISKSLTSKLRRRAISCEAIPDPRCLQCPAYNICNGDCQQLEWQGDKCAAPQAIFKEMMKKEDVDAYKKLII